jgi:hypothetical protein
MLIRRAELRAHHHRLESAPDEEAERGVEIQNPDALVIDGGEPAPEAGMFSRVFPAVRRG